MGVVPVGRLDKDTEGLLLLTNDGVWGHSIINGNKHVPKVYYVEFEGTLSDEGIQRIKEEFFLEMVRNVNRQKLNLYRYIQYM